MGKGTRPVLGGGRHCPLSFLIAIPITVMQDPAKTMTDIFDRPTCCGNIEGATSADSHPAGIGPDFGPRPHHGTHHIPGLKPLDLRPLLVLNAADFWLLERLHIEPDELLGNAGDGTDAQQSLDPGHHVAYSTLQRRGQPAGPSLAIGEARLSVARMATPSTVPYPTPLSEGLGARRSPMAELCGEDDFPRGLVHDRQPRGLASWIEFDAQPLCLWLLHHGFENKCEREAAQHRCLPLGEQEACVAWMHRV